MPQPDLDPDKKIVKGKSAPGERNLPPYGGHGGKIYTNLQDINWTPKKLVLTIALLGIPYVGVILACFIAAIPIFAYLLIGIAIFVGLMVMVLRLIDRQDF